jgi:hypothetical protein
MGTILANFGLYDSMMRGFITTSYMSGGAVNNRIEIYKGTMPDDADDWVVGGPGSPSELLVTFSNFIIVQHLSPTTDPNIDVQEAVFQLQDAPNPGTVVATAAGTAAWYAMYSTGTVATWGATLGNVSLSGGNGSLHLDKLDISGSPLPLVQLLHWGLRFQS